MGTKYRIVRTSKNGRSAQYWSKDYGFYVESEAYTFPSRECAFFVLDNIKNTFPGIYDEPKAEAVAQLCGVDLAWRLVCVGLLVCILLAVVLK